MRRTSWIKANIPSVLAANLILPPDFSFKVIVFIGYWLFVSYDYLSLSIISQNKQGNVSYVVILILMSEMPVEILKSLEDVETVEEKSELILECVVNKDTAAAKWAFNGKVIKPSTKYSVNSESWRD